MITRNDPCWCGSAKKWKKCHYPEVKPLTSFEEKAAYYKKKHNILLKTPEQIEGIRQSCKLAAQILDELCKAAVEGVTTQELDDLAIRLTKEAKAIPACLGYGSPPFPKSICTSLNEVICHGIPDDRPLQEGDILNIDYTCILNGYFGDCSRMVTIGTVSKERQLVVDVALKCRDDAIAIIKPGVEVYELADVIEDVAKSYGCSVVYQFVSHGVGVKFHEEPQIFHHRNKSKIRLEEGMTFTIEPMINAGLAEAVIDEDDEWTARTIDNRASGQWEHTILVTSDGYEILTLPN
ncbi:MAG: Methionine aminopeptidase [Chlamydiia bacterium]|nr:Methionine aminopeptidase [Chlamydiia bacterium]